MPKMPVAPMNPETNNSPSQPPPKMTNPPGFADGAKNSADNIQPPNIGNEIAPSTAFNPEQNRFAGHPDFDNQLTQTPYNRDIYGRGAMKRDFSGAEDPYVEEFTYPDPNERENSYGGNFVGDRTLWCDTCKMVVPAAVLAMPSHLAHNLMYDKNQYPHGDQMDVNESNMNQIGHAGGSYYLQPVKNPKPSPNSLWPVEGGGDTLGNTYRWQADVDRSCGPGVIGNRPVLEYGGDLSENARPYDHGIAGDLEERANDYDPVGDKGGPAYVEPLLQGVPSATNQAFGKDKVFGADNMDPSVANFVAPDYIDDNGALDGSEMDSGFKTKRTF